jgi:hypothetical protein
LSSDEAPPALFTHCCTVFEKMRQQSKPMKVEGQATLVYEGYLTRLFNELDMATPYYTTVMRCLKAMNCVKQLSRGGGSSPSRWELVNDPDFDVFDVIEQKRLRTNTQMGQVKDTTAIHTKRINELEDRVRMLEGRLSEWLTDSESLSS